MYWSRPLLKDNAKKVLTGNYWRVFAVCLLSSLLGANFKFDFNFSRNDWSSLRYNYEYGYGFSGFIASMVSAAAIALLIISIVWAVFVSNPVEVGANRFMMENRAGFPPVESMFSAFKGKDQYLNVVKVMFQLKLELFLWSLLCVIPGIYKSYQYYYVPYLLAENPYMSYSRAKELSIAMTNDEKMEIFILELSFFGWLFLGAMLCGVGVLFVLPYQEATFAELYAAARTKAFALGVTGPDELADFTRY